jgi:bifunctional NMN adenylyltransferase/nudix hydrolase
MGKIGVIIGRFQIDELHEGHRALIDYVIEKNDTLILFVGLSPLMCTFNNPLDFKSREKMLKEAYPDAIIMYIKDEVSDKSWSNKLDKMLKESVNPDDETCLYGSRDSFIRHYHGEYKTKELEQTVFTSGTSIRKEIATSVVNSADFRKGIIWATMHQYTGPATTVDVAILNDDETKVLLGRKEKESHFRFIGGFAESGESFEQTAHREALEETSLALMDLRYIKSIPVDDWRYKNEIELMWINIEIDLSYIIMDVHKPLAQTLLYSMGFVTSLADINKNP